MVKRVYVCDRCHEEISPGEGVKITPMYFDYITEDMTEPVSSAQDNKHYCIECTRRILKDLEGISAEQKKEEKPKKRNRADTGKVMALHNAGWSNAKIADEMRLEERQVYQIIRYQNKKAASEESEEKGEADE